MEALAAASMRIISDMRSQELTATVWAYAVMAFADEPLLASISASSRSRIWEFGPQSIGNMAWA